MDATISCLADLLRSHQCPYERSDSFSRLCTFSVAHPHSATIFCPFGHQAIRQWEAEIDENVDETASRANHNNNNLLPLPSYICVKHLLGECSTTTNNGNEEETASLPAQPSPLLRCSEGLHPSLADFLDVDRLHEKMFAQLAASDRRQAEALVVRNRLMKEVIDITHMLTMERERHRMNNDGMDDILFSASTRVIR